MGHRIPLGSRTTTGFQIQNWSMGKAGKLLSLTNEGFDKESPNLLLFFKAGITHSRLISIPIRRDSIVEAICQRSCEASWKLFCPVSCLCFSTVLAMLVWDRPATKWAHQLRLADCRFNNSKRIWTSCRKRSIVLFSYVPHCSFRNISDKAFFDPPLLKLLPYFCICFI